MSRAASTDQRGSRGASSARAHARSRRAQLEWSPESSSITHRRISSARTGKNQLVSAAW